jgi:SAM-dependent methyltransferase
MGQEKQWVRERYGEIAAGKQQGCCGSSSCCGNKAATTAQSIGYGVEELAAAPEGANLGLGCGNPLALAGIKPGEVVLDLGSGAGFDVFLAAARVGAAGRVIGVDMTPEMIAKARKNATLSGFAHVEFRLGEIEALPVETNAIDLVISNCVINLVPDKPKAFQEIFRVLKPGGRFSISDLVLERPLPEALKNDPVVYTSCVAGAIGREEYLQGLREAGLVEVEVTSAKDAADLLAGDCPGADLAGLVTSISVTGRKP